MNADQQRLLYPPVSLFRTFMYFAFFTLMLYLSSRQVIPVLNSWSFHPAISWFASSGLLVFLPMFCIAIYNASKETISPGPKSVMRRLWLTRPTSKDWLWAISGALVILIATAIIMYVSDLASRALLNKPFQTSPPFMHFEPLHSGQYWILLVWVFFFFFNIMGEELMWRGYLLAGISEKYPRRAWLYNAVFWLMFHIPFGYELMIMVLPTFFLVPYLVQKRKNTWIGIIIHASLNGPGFILVSLGVINQ